MNRKFGVELEIVGITKEQALAALRAVHIQVESEGYNHATRRHWKLVPDGSVHNGFEVVSPVLEGEAGLRELQIVATALDDIGATADRQCGLHVHFDANGFSVENFRTIVTRYAKFESEIDAFMPVSRRGNANRFCSSVIELANKISFRNATTIQELVNAQGGRYFKVNLQSYLTHGTIEFRQHSGTVNAAKAVNWVRFLDGFVEQCVAPAVQNASVSSSLDLSVFRGVQKELVEMLLQGEVSLQALCERFGWLSHSARAAITRIRQAGLEVRATRINGQAGYKLQQVAVQDSLFVNVLQDVENFYKNRTAVFACRA